jgi:hypothetical protein
MTWLQLLAQAAVFATILGFFVIVVAFLNSRNIRIELQRTNEIIREMDERHTAILAKMGKRTLEGGMRGGSQLCSGREDQEGGVI